jgi:hypothetical protein
MVYTQPLAMRKKHTSTVFEYPSSQQWDQGAKSASGEPTVTKLRTGKRSTQNWPNENHESAKDGQRMVILTPMLS